MKVLYKVMALFAAILIAVTVSFVKASPAQASLWSQCPSGSFCVFTSYFGENSQYPYCVFPGSQLAIQGLTIPSQCNNNSKSWSNKTPYSIILIDAGNCSMSGTGWRRTMGPGNNADGRGSDWINRISSLNRSGNANFCGI